MQKNIYKKNNYAIIFMCLILFISIFTYRLVMNKMQEYVDEYCTDELEYLVINTLNQITLDDMEANIEDYKNICEFILDANDEISAVTTDSYKINKIKNRINISVDDILENNTLDTVTVPIGSITNDFLMFDKGFDIPVKMDPMTTTLVEFASSFESQGINQTIHKIIVECTVEVTILTPYSRIDFEITHNISISETILLGSVPNSYTYINVN